MLPAGWTTQVAFFPKSYYPNRPNSKLNRQDLTNGNI